MITYKNTKIVMLQTKDKGPIVLGENLSVNLPGIFRGTNFHLYLTSDDEIKEGDWYIDDTSTVRQSVTSDKEYWSVRTDYKKIIATTDSSLSIYKDKNHSLTYGESLPKPSQSFIDKYIESYNKGNIITDVMVEYHSELYDGTETTNELSGRLKVNPKDNTITIKRMKDSRSREEVEDLIKEAVIDYERNKIDFVSQYPQWIDKWFKQNL